jgi:hypothetical protein
MTVLAANPRHRLPIPLKVSFSAAAQATASARHQGSVASTPQIPPVFARNDALLAAAGVSLPAVRATMPQRASVIADFTMLAPRGRGGRTRNAHRVPSTRRKMQRAMVCARAVLDSSGAGPGIRTAPSAQTWPCLMASLGDVSACLVSPGTAFSACRAPRGRRSLRAVPHRARAELDFLPMPISMPMPMPMPMPIPGGMEVGAVLPRPTAPSARRAPRTHSRPCRPPRSAHRADPCHPPTRAPRLPLPRNAPAAHRRFVTRSGARARRVSPARPVTAAGRCRAGAPGSGLPTLKISSTSSARA